MGPAEHRSSRDSAAAKCRVEYRASQSQLQALLLCKASPPCQPGPAITIHSSAVQGRSTLPLDLQKISIPAITRVQTDRPFSTTVLPVTPAGSESLQSKHTLAQ